MKNMTTEDALRIVMDIASRWGENAEEALPRRVKAEDTDTDLHDMFTKAYGPTYDFADDYDYETAIECRDLWQALEMVGRVVEQQGCEHFDKACDGKLTDLIDIIVYG